MLDPFTITIQTTVDPAALVLGVAAAAIAFGIVGTVSAFIRWA